MRLAICLVIGFLCFICLAAKKVKDEDFSEFDDFDQDEFVVGKCHENPCNDHTSIVRLV